MRNTGYWATNCPNTQRTVVRNSGLPRIAPNGIAQHTAQCAEYSYLRPTALLRLTMLLGRFVGWKCWVSFLTHIYESIGYFVDFFSQILSNVSTIFENNMEGSPICINGPRVLIFVCQNNPIYIVSSIKYITNGG
jgi:hypothetical protein